MDNKDNIDYGQLMTGAVLTGVQNAPNVKPNVEVEDGEYVQFPDGSVGKALGDKHENGGVKLIAPNMTEVLSNTKDAPITKELVKKLKKEYGLYNISTNDTYSKVLDKYARKIGYTKVINQEADLFNQVKKNTENALSEGSLRINNEYLAKKIYNLQSEKQPLQEEFSSMFSVLFDTQQAEKGEDDQIIVPPIQEGELTEEQVFRLGGRVEDVKSMASKYGLTASRAYQILEQSNALPKFDGGGVVWTDFNKYQQNYQNIPTYRAGEITPQGQRLMNIINNAQAYGDLGSVNVGTQQEQDQTAGLYQKWLYEKVPAVAEDYSSTMPPTKQGMEYLVKNNILSEKDFEKIGVKVPKRAGQVLGFESGQLSEDKIKEVNNLIQEKLSSPELKKEYLRNNFIDNKWFFRAPEIQTVRFKDEAEKDATLKDYTKVGDNVYKSSKTGLYFIPQVDAQPVPPAQIKPEEKKDQTALSPPIQDDIEQPINVTGNRMFQMPDQSYLPPSALQAESMYDTELGRIDPVRLGIEDTIRRNQDNTQFLASQLKSLPPTVAAGIMASAIAQNQQSENQAINQIHQINAQNIAQAEQFNVRQADIEETTNNASRLNYEQRALLGLSKTEQDIRNYYNANREININNFREQQWMNTASNLFPQYSIGMSGTDVVFDPTTQTYFKSQNPFFTQALATQQSTQQPTTQKKKSQ